MATAALPPGLMDTDVLIDTERGLPDAVAFFGAQFALGSVQMSAVSAMELIAGARNQAELKKVLNSISNAVVHELSAGMSRQARHWLAQYSLSHGLEFADALIGATAFHLGLPLYTKNVKHFQMLPGLNVVRPY